MTVAWATSKGASDTATPGTDYTAGSGTLSFAAGATSKTVTVKVTGDQVDEANETLTLTLSGATGADIGDATATGTITDDDTRGIVLSKSAVTVTEASGAGRTADYKVRLASQPTGTVTVAVSSGTTSAATVNKTSLSFTTTTWNTDQTVTVTGVDDSIDNNPDRTATVGHRASGGDYGSVSKDLTVTVTDDDLLIELSTLGASLSVANASVSEGDTSTASLTFTVTLSTAEESEVTVAWATSKETGDTATPGTDYTAGSGTLTFAAGETSKTATVTVIGDVVDEANETLTLTLSNASGASIGTAAATGTINDDDDAPSGITLVASPDSVTENGGAKTVTVTASVNGTTRYAAAKTVAMTVGKGADSATEGTDYATVADLTISIAAGAASGSKSFTLTPTNDALDESNETISVEGTSAGVTVTADQITITDDDGTPTLTLKLSKSSISENGGVTTVTAELSGASSEAVTVTVSAAPVSPAVSGDYTLSANKLLTIAAGQTNSTGTVTITAVNNSVDAPDKEITVSGTASGGRGAANPASKTLTITDDDGTPTLTLKLSKSTISESGGSSTVTATLSATSSEAVTVTVSAAPVSPAASSDYKLSANKTLTIAAGQTSSSGTVTITAVDNDADAPDKEVTVSGAASGGNGAANPANKTLTIADDDGIVVLSVSPSSVQESADATTATVSARLPGAARNAATTITVKVGDSADAATEGTDYATVADLTLTITAGQTSGTAEFSMVPTQDSINEGTGETLSIRGSTSASGLIVTATLMTITDDDDATSLSKALPSIALSVSPSSVAESADATTATVTARLSDGARSTDTAITVKVGDSADAATEGTDYATVADFTLTITAGQTSGTAGFSMDPTQDSIDEGSGETLSISGSSSTSELSVTGTQMTITDDDGTPTLTLNLSKTSISENGGVTTVTAELSAASSEAVTVTVSAAPVSPATSSDYTLSQNTTLTIAAGATSSTGTVTITAVDNNTKAPDKEITVSGTASGGRGAANPANKTLTIADDDGAIALSVLPSSVAESASATTTTVTATLPGAARSAATAITVSVGDSTDTATEGTDYATVDDFTLTIAAGATSGTAEFSMSPTQDTIDEGTGETLSISATTNVSGLNVTATQMTIDDDDSTPTLTLVLSASSISENGGESTVTAELSAASSEAITVTVSAAPVNPATSSDYTLSQNKTLTIAAGETSSTGVVTITAVDNSVVAPNKEVTVSGEASGGHGAFDPADQTLTIADDDGTPKQTQKTDTNPESDGIVLSVSPRSVAESASATTVTVTAELPDSAKRDATMTITVSVGDDADAATEGTDYATVDDFTLTIAAGASSSAATFSIEPIDDAINEGDESLSISGSTTVSGLSVSGTQMTITDNDATPTETQTTVTLILSIPEPTGELNLKRTSLSEKGEVATITAALSNALTSALTIEISATPVSPATEDDYVLSDNTTLTVEAGSTDSTGTVNLTAVDNMMDSADKEVTISGTVNSDSGISDPLDQTLTIIDDDERGLVLSKDEITVTEAPGYRHSQRYKVSLATQPTDTVRVDLTTDDEQMVTVEPKTLTFGTEDWREERTVVVTGMDDESVATDPEQRVMLFHTASGGDYGSIVEPAMVVVMDDDMPATENPVDLQPWLARFGRTITDQAIDLVTARLDRSPAPGGDVILAGQSLMQWSPDSDVSSLANDEANSYPSAEDSSTDIHAMETAVETDNFSLLANPRDNAQTRTLSEKELLTGTSFSLTTALDNTGHNFASLWGEGVVTSFEGEAGGIRLDGKVSSGYVGFDFATHENTTGLSLGHSRGKGTYSDTDCDDQNCDGSIVASLTGVYPYGKFQVTDRMSLWAAAGIGDGDVTFERSDGEVSKTNLSYAMAAIGMRNEITDAGADDGFSLAWKADARFTRTTSDRSGNLAGTVAEVSLVRFGLEGSRSIQLGRDGMVLTPSFGLNLRYDGGDAEKGLGAELQGGLGFVNENNGLSIDIAARGLIAHKSKGFRERSVSAALAWDPNAASDEGVSMSLKHSWSSMPSGGQALNSTLWENSIAGLSASDSENVSQSTQLIRTSLEMGYGMSAFNGRFIATPNFAIESSSDSSRNLRLGWKLSSTEHSDSVFTLSADITRDISAGNPKPEHGFKLSAELRF